jgi:hypothetical protein
MKQRYAYIILSVGLITAVVLTRTLRKCEPSYEGRPLTVWIIQLHVSAAQAAWPAKVAPDVPGLVTADLNTPEGVIRMLRWEANHEQAAAAIRAIGPKAIPFILQSVRADDSAFLNVRRDLWYELPRKITRRLSGPRPVDRGLRVKAAIALSALGPSGLAYWKDAFLDRSSAVRFVAARSVAELKVGASQAQPFLIPLLRDPHPEVRMAALNALQETGPATDDALESFVTFLRTNLAQVGTNALSIDNVIVIRMLGARGHAARVAVPVLTEFLHETNRLTRSPLAKQAIADALRRIDPNAISDSSSNAEPTGVANRNQPASPQTNRPSAAAGGWLRSLTSPLR